MQVVAVRLDKRALDNIAVIMEEFDCDRSAAMRFALEDLADVFRDERNTEIKQDG
jgi:hypothetical protein